MYTIIFSQLNQILNFLQVMEQNIYKSKIKNEKSYVIFSCNCFLYMCKYYLINVSEVINKYM